MTWNSGIPFSINDGTAWAGRGATAQTRLGVHLRYSALSLTLAPELSHSQNRAFAYPAVQSPERSEFLPPWYRGPRSADLPLRFGDRPSSELTPGQSTLELSPGPVTVGVSTENQWWGPGIRNAILMSNNAPGFPHLFLGTARPLRSRIGGIEAKWIVGKLSESEFFDTLPDNDVRSLSAMVVTYQPAWEPSLTVGYARSVYAPVENSAAVAGRFADVVTRWRHRNDVEADEEDFYDQIVSFFGRWVLPGDGLEFYGEWARQDLPSSIPELVEDVGYSHGYTVGVQWAKPMREREALRLQTEVTYLEQTDRTRERAPSFYVSATVPQGYTHRGQVIGAAIGPGASSQWLAADYLAPTWSAGVFGGRIRWDNDSYYNTARALQPWPFLAHDVSVLGGVRGSYSVPWLRVTGEVTRANRLNFLYQNRGASWETADDAVDVRNYTLRLGIEALPRSGPRLPGPVEVAPLPPAPVVEDAGTLGRARPARGDSADAPVGSRAVTADSLRAGLATPGASPDSAAPAPEEVRLHVVRPGETVYGISRTYGIAPAELLRMNPTARPDRLSVGAVLRIPQPRSRQPESATLVRNHRVRQGETLFGIARTYGVRAEQIRSLNNLRDDAIYAGQVLRIPAPGEVPPE